MFQQNIDILIKIKYQSYGQLQVWQDLFNRFCEQPLVNSVLDSHVFLQRILVLVHWLANPARGRSVIDWVGVGIVSAGIGVKCEVPLTDGTLPSALCVLDYPLETWKTNFENLFFNRPNFFMFWLYSECPKTECPKTGKQRYRDKHLAQFPDIITQLCAQNPNDTT